MGGRISVAAEPLYRRTIGATMMSWKPASAGQERATSISFSSCTVTYHEARTRRREVATTTTPAAAVMMTEMMACATLSLARRAPPTRAPVKRVSSGQMWHSPQDPSAQPPYSRVRRSAVCAPILQFRRRFCRSAYLRPIVSSNWSTKRVFQRKYSLTGRENTTKTN